MTQDKRVRLQPLIHPDPNHVYNDDELDAIEHIDMAMALRIARVQHISQLQMQNKADNCDSEKPIDEQKINEAIREIKQILAHDGGDIELVAICDRTITVRMKGACVGCPNAVLDLKNVVERLLKQYASGVQKVVNIF